MRRAPLLAFLSICEARNLLARSKLVLLADAEPLEELISGASPPSPVGPYSSSMPRDLWWS